MLPFFRLLPPGFLDERRVRIRFLLGKEPPGQLTVLFQSGDQRRDNEKFIGAMPRSFMQMEGAMAGFSGLTYVLSGRAQVIAADGRKQVAASGDLIYFTDCAVGSNLVLCDPGFLECSVCFDLDVSRHLRELGLWRNHHPIQHAGESAALVLAYHDLYEAAADTTVGHAGLLNHLLRIIELAETAVDSQGTDDSFSLQAKRLFTEHPEPGFTVAHAASALGLPTETFRRRFTREVGCPPGAWQLKQRLEQAATLLHHHPVAEVASRLGYSDPSVLARQFKLVLGVHPSSLIRDPGGRER